MTTSPDRNRTCDVVIIGGGLNGLAAATVLGRAKLKVVVLERRSMVGGLAAGEEFHPGYRSAGVIHDTTGLLPELDLTSHGLRRTVRPPPILAIGADDRALLLHHDPTEAASELMTAGGRDVEPYSRFRAFIERIKPFARRLVSELPPDWLGDGMADWRAMLSTGFALRRLGKTDMMELLRLGPMSVADWLDEQFTDPLLKAALAVPALHGCFAGPFSPGTCGALLRYETLAGGAVIGGSDALVETLVREAEAAGAVILTGREVSRILVGQDGVTGVACDDGQHVEARLVVSSCDPKRTLLELLGARELAPADEQAIRAYRMRGLTAQVNLALNRPLRFRARPDREVEFARTGASLPELERTFDAGKYGRFSDTPALDLHVPSMANPQSAPSGHSCVSILIHGVPYDLHGGWSDARRDDLGDAVVKQLSRFVDGLDSAIVARQVLTPVDIESKYGVTGGHIYHGEHGLDQLLVRPTRACARYATPIDGLYLCGSGSHPGGGITCAPGFIAAKTVLDSREGRS